MGKTHGMSGTRFHNIWRNIKARCNNKVNKNWHGRGITYCKSWESFLNFKEDMYETYLAHVEEHGEKDTQIDRIDNNGDYRSDNCRWATWSEQQSNTRANHLITYNGKTQTIRQWEEELDLSRSSIHARLKLGWSTEKALETPKPSPKKLAFSGQNLTIKEWSNKIGINESRIYKRLKYGWSVEKALTVPATIGNNQHNMK